jgi:hypothetical protein
MRNILALLAILSIPSLAFGQAMSLRNDAAGTTGKIIGNGNLQNSAIAVDSNGRIFSTLTLGIAGANNAIKAEDSVATSGDAGVGMLVLNNQSAAVLASAGDYLLPAANQYGMLYVGESWQLMSTVDSNNSGLKLEDQNFPEGGAVKMVGTRFKTTATQSAGTNDDASFFNTDGSGRLYVNAHGAGAGETFSNCSAAVTTTTRAAIKTAVASNRHYTTSITCKNSSTVPSGITFTDGAGASFGVGSVAAVAVGGGFSISFPVPARGTVNTDISMTMDVTSTSTICCANGYISTN